MVRLAPLSQANARELWRRLDEASLRLERCDAGLPMLACVDTISAVCVHLQVVERGKPSVVADVERIKQSLMEIRFNHWEVYREEWAAAHGAGIPDLPALHDTAYDVRTPETPAWLVAAEVL